MFGISKKKLRRGDKGHCENKSVMMTTKSRTLKSNTKIQDPPQRHKDRLEGSYRHFLVTSSHHFHQRFGWGRCFYIPPFYPYPILSSSRPLSSSNKPYNLETYRPYSVVARTSSVLGLDNSTLMVSRTRQGLSLKAMILSAKKAAS